MDKQCFFSFQLLFFQRKESDSEYSLEQVQEIVENQLKINIPDLEEKNNLKNVKCNWVPLSSYQRNPSEEVQYDRQSITTQQTQIVCDHPKILIVDDDMFNVLALQQILKQKNISNAFATNGQQAIDMVKAQQQIRSKCFCKNFSLILMDLNMPILDGFEATKYLLALMQSTNEQEKISQIPIIGCSAYGEEKQNCLALGMSDFMTKPLSAKAVQEKIVKFIY